MRSLQYYDYGTTPHRRIWKKTLRIVDVPIKRELTLYVTNKDGRTKTYAYHPSKYTGHDLRSGLGGTTHRRAS